MTKRQNLIWSLFLILTISSFLFLEYQIHQKDMILKTDIFYLKNNPLSVAEAKKKYQNKDIIGYISIPFTSIHTFFTKSTNNTYYLNRNLKKQKLGTIFLDYLNTFYYKQMNLYGHNGNVKNAPFYDLNQYKKKTFYQKHPYIYLTLGEQIRIYQIFSTIITTETKHMNLFFKEEKKWQEYLKFLVQKSLYKTNIYPNRNDSILILQTCTYERKDAFLLICAKQIEGENL